MKPCSQTNWFSVLLLLVFCPFGKSKAQQTYQNLTLVQIDSLRKENYSKGRFEDAARFALQYIDALEALKVSNDSLHALAFHNTGNAFNALQDYEEAEAYYLKAKDLRKKALGENSIDYTATLNNMATLYKSMGKYEEAERMHLLVKEAWEKLVGKQHPYYAANINNLSILYASLGNYAAAEPLQVEALKIQESTLGKKHPSYLGSCVNLADTYRRMKRFEDAEKLFLSNKQQIEAALGKENSLYFDNLNNLAVLYSSQGQHEKAQQLRLEMKAYYKQFGSNNPRYILSLNSIANGYGYLKKTEEAWKNVQMAIAANAGADSIPTHIDQNWLNVIKSYKYSNHEGLLYSLGIMHSLLKGYYQPEKSVLQEQQYVIKAALYFLHLNENGYSDDNDKFKVLHSSTDWSIYAVENSIALGGTEHLSAGFSLSEISKSSLLSNALRQKKAYRFGDLPDSIANQEMVLKKQYAQLQAALLEEKNDTIKQKIRAELSKLNATFESFKKDIEQKYPKYSRLKYERPLTAPTDIQKLLPKETAMISYLLSDSVVYAFYVDAKETNVKSIRLSKEQLKQKIDLLRKNLSYYDWILHHREETYNQYCQSAFWCYEQLLAPVLKGKSVKNLIIVPDGILGHIPFEAFLTAPVSDKKDYKDLPYLLKEYGISYSYSASLWVENLQSKANNNKKMLAIAASYKGKNDKMRARSASLQNRSLHLRNLRDALQDLPAAKEEVKALSQLFDGDFWQEDFSNERNFKEKAGEYGIIHLAMHGLLNKQHPILSSLAFTENGDSLEDNFLQAYEISQMQLKANLVVLSACETGYGKFQQGEGVMSLARSFMYAGIPSVVVSLWQVNDASTAAIMQLFYKNLSKGMNKAAALRLAKLDYINAAVWSCYLTTLPQHPAFSAPFIIIGDDRPISIGTSTGFFSNFWVIGIGALSAVVIAIVALRRKKQG